MNAVIQRNGRRGKQPPVPPQREDGTGLYAYALTFDGGRSLAYADTVEDLLAVLVPGYANRTEQERLVARIRLAVDVQVAVQAMIVVEASEEDLAALTSADTEVLLGPRFEQPRVDCWNSPIPLVLVETGYAPYVAGRGRPTSGLADVESPPNMLWLCPVDEWEFLVSLTRTGWVTLHVADT